MQDNFSCYQYCFIDNKTLCEALLCEASRCECVNVNTRLCVG